MGGLACSQRQTMQGGNTSAPKHAEHTHELIDWLIDLLHFKSMEPGLMRPWGRVWETPHEGGGGARLDWEHDYRKAVLGCASQDVREVQVPGKSRGIVCSGHL